MKTKLGNSLFFIIFTVLLTLMIMLGVQSKNSLKSNQYSSASYEHEITVILDAGHGGEDGGAVGNGSTYEKDLNLAITLKIGKLLEDNGISVIYTRTEDILLYDTNVDYTNRKKALDLAARVKVAEETPNSIFVSIHMNSFPKTQYKGLQVYYSKNHPDSKALASAIQSGVKSDLQPDNTRKITEATSRIFLLDRIERPAILIECGFLSNYEECRLLSTEIYQNQLAEIISEEIEKYVEKNAQTY